MRIGANRNKVCETVRKYEPTLGRENEIYCMFSGKSFYTVTNFRLNDPGSDRVLDALMEYSARPARICRRKACCTRCACGSPDSA